MPRDDRAAHALGRYLRVPMIVGIVAGDGGGVVRTLGVKTVAVLQGDVACNSPGHEARAQAAYAAASDAEGPGVLSDLVSDTQHRFGTCELLRVTAPREPRLWRHVFAQRRNGDAALPIHGAELQTRSTTFGRRTAAGRGPSTRPMLRWRATWRTSGPAS